MPTEVWTVLALNWVLLIGASLWLLRRGSTLDRRLKERRGEAG